jgi:hypothetical protein
MRVDRRSQNGVDELGNGRWALKSDRRRDGEMRETIRAPEKVNQRAIEMNVRLKQKNERYTDPIE